MRASGTRTCPTIRSAARRQLRSTRWKCRRRAATPASQSLPRLRDAAGGPQGGGRRARLHARFIAQQRRRAAGGRRRGDRSAAGTGRGAPAGARASRSPAGPCSIWGGGATPTFMACRWRRARRCSTVSGRTRRPRSMAGNQRWRVGRSRAVGQFRDDASPRPSIPAAGASCCARRSVPARPARLVSMIRSPGIANLAVSFRREPQSITTAVLGRSCRRRPRLWIPAFAGMTAERVKAMAPPLIGTCSKPRPSSAAAPGSGCALHGREQAVRR